MKTLNDLEKDYIAKKIKLQEAEALIRTIELQFEPLEQMAYRNDNQLLTKLGTIKRLLDRYRNQEDS